MIEAVTHAAIAVVNATIAAISTSAGCPRLLRAAAQLLCAWSPGWLTT